MEETEKRESLFTILARERGKKQSKEKSGKSWNEDFIQFNPTDDADQDASTTNTEPIPQQLRPEFKKSQKKNSKNNSNNNNNNIDTSEITTEEITINDNNNENQSNENENEEVATDGVQATSEDGTTTKKKDRKKKKSKETFGGDV